MTSDNFSVDDILSGAQKRAQQGAPVRDLMATDPAEWVKVTGPKIDAKEVGYGLIPFVAWPHQEALMRAQFGGKSIVVDKSRQTGVTTCLMVGMAHGVIYGLPWHGHVIAQTEDVAIGVLLEIAKLALTSADLTEAQRSKLTITGTKIEYRDENRHNYIRAHSAGPNTARSFPGNRILLEEVAFMVYAEDIYRAVRPMLDDGAGSVSLVSTYNGAGDFFCHAVDYAEAMGLRHMPVDWRSRPDRDDAWKIKSMSGFEGRIEEWEEEHELKRISAGDMLFNMETIDALTKEYHDVCIHWRQHPVKGHHYLKGVDVAGKGRAHTVCSAIDMSTDPPHLAVQEVSGEQPFPEKLATIRAFDAKYPGASEIKPSTFIDGGGPGEAIVDSLEDMRPRPIAIRLIGGSATAKRKRDRKTAIFWQNEPRDRLITYSAQKFEAGAVIIPTWFKQLRLALKSARWEKDQGQYVDELDSLMIASYEVETDNLRRRSGGDSPVKGLPSTGRLQTLLGLARR